MSPDSWFLRYAKDVSHTERNNMKIIIDQNSQHPKGNDYMIVWVGGNSEEKDQISEAFIPNYGELNPVP